MSEILLPTITTVALTNASTEYSIDLPSGCKRFEFQCRDAHDCFWSFTSGLVATPTDPYMTLKSGTSYTAPEKLCVDPGITTIYFASANAGSVIELVAWA